jgi:hypothetical protein
MLSQKALWGSVASYGTWLTASDAQISLIARDAATSRGDRSDKYSNALSAWKKSIESDRNAGRGGRKEPGTNQAIEEGESLKHLYCVLEIEPRKRVSRTEKKADADETPDIPQDICNVH